MVILQLKQCERALADGRLDEAYELVRRADVRAHRRGQELTGELVSALVRRGRGHLAQGRLAAAAIDAGKAVQLGGNMPDAAELRDAVATAQRNGDRMIQQAGQALALARRHIEQGQLTVGQQLLTDSPLNDARLEDLKQELNAHRLGLESSLKKAAESFDTGDWETAIDHLALAAKGGLQDLSIRRLAERVADHVAAQVIPHFESGKLDAAAALMEKVARLPVKTTAMDRLQATLDLCRSISVSIEKGVVADTAESLLRLQMMWPTAAWIGELVEHARQWGDAVTALRTSPLSLLGKVRVAATPASPFFEGTPKGDGSVAATGKPVLHVDGIGSYQVLTESIISIGPRGSSRKLDLALMIDSSAPTIRLSRSDEDYFLTAESPVTVNEWPCTSRLLRDGDRIGLGRRCRLTFRRPTAASGTAILDISGAVPTAGVRQVILMDREIVMGPGTAVHIRADQLRMPAVLIRSDGGSGFCSTGNVEVDGKILEKNAVLPPGVSINIGSLRFVISREQRP